MRFIIKNKHFQRIYLEFSCYFTSQVHFFFFLGMLIFLIEIKTKLHTPKKERKLFFAVYVCKSVFGCVTMCLCGLIFMALITPCSTHVESTSSPPLLFDQPSSLKVSSRWQSSRVKTALLFALPKQSVRVAVTRSSKPLKADKWFDFTQTVIKHVMRRCTGSQDGNGG